MVDPITEETVARIVEEFKGGLPIPEIADKLEVTRNTVYKYLDKEGVYSVNEERSRKASKRLTRKERDRIRQLYHKGVPIKEIAEELGTTTSTLYSHIRKNGAKRQASPEQLNKAIEMYHSDNYTVDYITDKTGVSRTTLYRHLKKE